MISGHSLQIRGQFLRENKISDGQKLRGERRSPAALGRPNGGPSPSSWSLVVANNFKAVFVLGLKSSVYTCVRACVRLGSAALDSSVWELDWFDWCSCGGEAAVFHGSEAVLLIFQLVYFWRQWDRSFGFFLACRHRAGTRHTSTGAVLTSPAHVCMCTLYSQFYLYIYITFLFFGRLDAGCFVVLMSTRVGLFLLVVVGVRQASVFSLTFPVCLQTVVWQCLPCLESTWSFDASKWKLGQTLTGAHSLKSGFLQCVLLMHIWLCLCFCYLSIDVALW